MMIHGCCCSELPIWAGLYAAVGDWHTHTLLVVLLNSFWGWRESLLRITSFFCLVQGLPCCAPALAFGGDRQGRACFLDPVW